jgi:hypothetical protein
MPSCNDFLSVPEVLVLLMGPYEYKGLENLIFGKIKILLICACADKRKTLQTYMAKSTFTRLLILNIFFEFKADEFHD